MMHVQWCGEVLASIKRTKNKFIWTLGSDPNLLESDPNLLASDPDLLESDPSAGTRPRSAGIRPKSARIRPKSSRLWNGRQLNNQVWVNHRDLCKLHRSCMHDFLQTPRQMSVFQPNYMSVKFSSVQGGIYALGKAHIRSASSLRIVPNIAFETVPVFMWLTMALYMSEYVIIRAVYSVRISRLARPAYTLCRFLKHQLTGKSIALGVGR